MNRPGVFNPELIEVAGREPPPPPADGGDFVDLRGIWFVLRRRLSLFVAVAGVVFTVVGLITFQLPEVYRGTASLLIASRESEVVDLPSIVSGINSPDATVVDTEVQVMSSRTLIGQVVDKLELTKEPAFNPYLAEPKGFDAWIKGLRRAAKNAVSSVAPTGSGPSETVAAVPDLAGREDLEREIAIGRVTSAAHVARVGSTYVVSVDVRTGDPELSAAIANAIADQYIDNQLSAKVAATRRANNLLNERLQTLQHQLREAEAAVEDFRSSAGLLDSRGVTLNEQQIAELNAQLILMRQDLSEKDVRLRSLNSLRNGGSIDQVLEIVNSPLIRDLRSQKAAVQRRQGELSTRYGPLHPEMQRVTQELVEIQDEIDSEMTRVVATLRNEREVARDRVYAVESSISQLRGELQADNVSLIQLRQLEREAEASRLIYESFLQRYEQTTQQEALQQADATIIARAQIPSWPDSPNRKLNLFLGALFSGGLAAVAVFLIESFDSGLRTTQEVERAFNQHALGLVPTVNRGIARRASVNSVADRLLEKPFSAYSESIRSVRSALLLAPGGRGAHTIAITSAAPAEGKSTFAFSFARASALAQVRTIVIDADLRRCQLTESVAPKAEGGLTEVLEGTASIEDVIIKDSQTDLAILPAGRGHRSAGHAVALNRMPDVMQWLSENFELVVFDTSPVLAIADTREIASMADAVVVIARWRKTPRGATQAALRLLQGVNANIAGVVLTQANMRVGALYSGEGGYNKLYGKYYIE